MLHAKLHSSILTSVLTFAILLGAATTAFAQKAALVRDMDSPIRGIRHFEQFVMNFSAGAFSVSETITPAIPAGKKWFIQSVDVHTLLTDGQGVMEARATIAGARFWVPQAPQAGAQQVHFTGSRDINMVLNAGETVTLFLFRNNNLGASSSNFSNVTVVGYFVDANP